MSKTYIIFGLFLRRSKIDYSWLIFLLDFSILRALNYSVWVSLILKIKPYPPLFKYYIDVISYLWRRLVCYIRILEYSNEKLIVS